MRGEEGQRTHARGSLQTALELSSVAALPYVIASCSLAEADSSNFRAEMDEASEACWAHAGAMCLSGSPNKEAGVRRQAQSLG